MGGESGARFLGDRISFPKKEENFKNFNLT